MPSLGAEARARQRVGRGHPEEHREERRRHAHDGTVAERARELPLEERAVVLERGNEQEPGRHLERLRLHLERHLDEPEHREQRDREETEGNGVDDERAHAARRPRRTLTRLDTPSGAHSTSTRLPTLPRLPLPRTDDRRADRKDGDQDDHADRSREADQAVVEALEIRVVVGGLRDRPGPASGHDEDERKRLHALDQPEQCRHDDGRAQQRQDDMSEDLPASGAVHPGRLQRFLGHHLQRGQQHQHGEGEPFPHVRDDDRGQGQARLREPRRRRDADETEQPVDHADVRREEHLPDDADDDRRQHHGDDEQGADGFEEAEPAVAGASRSRDRAGAGGSR